MGKEPRVFLVDLGEGADKAGVKAAAVLANIGRVGQRLVGDLFQMVISVYLPALQEADANGVRGAEERAAHAHVAGMTEADLSPFHADILFRAIAHAALAEGTFFGVRLIEKGVDKASEFLNGEDGGKGVVKQIALYARADAVFQVIEHNFQQFFVLSQDFPNERLFIGEMDGIGHDKVVLAAKHGARFFHVSQKGAAGGIVNGERFAAVFIDKEALSRRKAQGFEVAIEGARRIKGIDGIAEPDPIVSGSIRGGGIAVDLHARHGMAAGLKVRLRAVGEVARIERAGIIEKQNVHRHLLRLILELDFADLSEKADVIDDRFLQRSRGKPESFAGLSDGKVGVLAQCGERGARIERAFFSHLCVEEEERKSRVCQPNGQSGRAFFLCKVGNVSQNFVDAVGAVGKDIPFARFGALHDLRQYLSQVAYVEVVISVAHGCGKFSVYKVNEHLRHVSDAVIARAEHARQKQYAGIEPMFVKGLQYDGVGGCLCRVEPGAAESASPVEGDGGYGQSAGPEMEIGKRYRIHILDIENSGKTHIFRNRRDPGRVRKSEEG